MPFNLLTNICFIKSDKSCVKFEWIRDSLLIFSLQTSDLEVNMFSWQMRDWIMRNHTKSRHAMKCLYRRHSNTHNDKESLVSRNKGLLTYLYGCLRLSISIFINSIICYIIIAHVLIVTFRQSHTSWFPRKSVSITVITILFVHKLYFVKLIKYMLGTGTLLLLRLLKQQV